MIDLHSLSNMPRWIAWRNEPRGGKLTKVPYSPSTERPAEADDHRTWGPRGDAEALAGKIVNGQGGGIGFELGDLGDGMSVGGVDLDTCRSPEGVMEPWATEVIYRFRSYCEISPSETGAKIYFLYKSSDIDVLRQAMGGALYGKQFKLPGAGKDHPPAIEVYLGNRYFAVTEWRIPDVPAEIVEVSTADLIWLLKEFGPSFSANGNTDSTKISGGQDKSRSAIAYRVGLDIIRAGGTYEQMCEAIKTNPETASWYFEKGDKRQLKRIWDRTQVDDLEYVNLTEDSVALAFAERFCGELRYCHNTGAWFKWTGTRWQKEETRLAFHWARQICRELASEHNGKAPAALSKAATAASIERFCQADRHFAVTINIWDRNPMLLGTPGGTVDLRTGRIGRANPMDFITQQTSVAPAETADCPLWLKFLDDTTGGDKGMQRFLQQWAGYCLTGDTREHALSFVYGPGGNGKSVWQNTLLGIWADYGVVSAMETFTASTHERHPTDLAMLRGKRLVCASETEEGRPWAEVRIKNMTGGEMISARFMRQDFFQYLPQFKISLIGNHKPSLRNVDDAIRRRLNILPFIRTPLVPDTQLEYKLKAEWSAILRWAILGCLDWLQNGLIRPKSVVEATASYFNDQDTLSQWIADRCEVGNLKADATASLFDSWSKYALANGERPGTAKWLSEALQKAGFEPCKHTPGRLGKRGFLGIAVKAQDTQAHWQEQSYEP